MAEILYDERKAQIASLTGLEVDRVGSVSMELSVLRRHGLLVDLCIRGTGMFKCTADWGEVGVAQGAKRQKRLTKGQKYLFPEDVVSKILTVETRMRQWLDKFSFKVTGFAPYRWLPASAYKSWVAKWDELQGEFGEVKADILSNYDEYVDLLADDFREIASEAWYSVDHEVYKWMVFDHAGYDNLDAFTDAIVKKALSKVPSRSDIETKLIASYTPALVYGSEDFARDEANAALVREQAAVADAQLQAAKNVAYLEQQKINEDLAHTREMNRLSETQKDLEISAMFAAEADRARAELASIASPFEEVFVALRRQMADAAVEMLESIQEQKYVRGKVAERAAALMEAFEIRGKYANDTELLARLVELKKAIGPIGKERTKDMPERSTADAVRALEGVAALIETAVEDFRSGPSRFGNLD